eukprot:COSAG04_NODE_512_length_13248_cov_51.630314_6_plen_136_part_00
MGGSQPEISERRATSLEDQATTTLSDDEVAAVNAKGPPPAPDYSDLACWAAYPGQPSPAELAPDGETLLPNAERPADCFFVSPLRAAHPTPRTPASSFHRPAAPAAPARPAEHCLWLPGAPYGLLLERLLESAPR